VTREEYENVRAWIAERDFLQSRLDEAVAFLREIHDHGETPSLNGKVGDWLDGVTDTSANHSSDAVPNTLNMGEPETLKMVELERSATPACPDCGKPMENPRTGGMWQCTHIGQIPKW
jgi:hypothetical protein